MNKTRRDVLCLGAALGVGGLSPTLLTAAAEPTHLTAKLANVQLAPSKYPQTSIWGYDGKIPGTLIRAQQGDRITRRFVNELPQPSSVHWHGLRIDNAMDGVAGLTQDAVEPGDTFDYDFVARDAGTYWYHAHNKSVEQVARGLYGALIVDEAEPVDVDRDEVLILDDWLLDTETAQLDSDYASGHDRSHAGRRGNYIATNGAAFTEIPVGQNQRLRLRLINAANARIFQLSLAGFDGWVMAYDGMPLEVPEKVDGPFLLAPGQRVDLFVDVIADAGETAHLVRVDDGEGYSQVTFPVGSDPTSRLRRDVPKALPPNPDMDVPGIETARRFELHMEGGAMGGLERAKFNGKDMGFRALINANQFWSFNGVVGMTETPLADLSVGETARINIRNDTAFPHAMHLHGMHVREVLDNGDMGPLRDTLLVFPDEAREIAFVAGGSGKWIFHCHMLGHSASGMATWVNVE
ncbi:multicopper oxidase family protein [Parasedimentitalea huanghaiensis]|uniref:Multicopper oxidase domain-containing protein n=1 Tax=Parasedimentitalea huanghaiensis TaxID=2682100 RepID=A0A6L6WIJ8_9RHOB|nr:multicopper oxidase family protein [Zongyanglinia huanghaiensis]MVO17613.1 multicopper oxidase domain-containing protein [Zongyanglinia huanghaiensis]